MRTSFLAIASGLAGLTWAQSFGGVPKCAVPCVEQYASGNAIAGCNNLDIACICSNSNFLGGIACCLAAVCNAADQQTAVTFAQNLCKSNGVTNLPSAVSCSTPVTSSATGSSIASASGGTASLVTSSPSSGGGSSTTSSVPSSASTQAASVTDTTSLITSSTSSGSGSSISSSVASSASTKAASVTSTGSATSGPGSTASSATASASHNSGPHDVTGVGAGIFCGLAAAVALL